jgi:hypothetical protein
MFMQRAILQEIVGVWHAHAESVTATADKERAAAAARESRAAEEIDRARDERENLIQAFEVQESVTGQMLSDAKRELAEARTRIDGLERALAVAQNNFEWARVRLNAVEQERAILIDRVMGVRVPVPEMSREPAAAGTVATGPREAEDARSALLAGLGLPLNIFDDIGDTAAAAAGLDHDDLDNVVPK